MTLTSESPNSTSGTSRQRPRFPRLLKPEAPAASSPAPHIVSRAEPVQGTGKEKRQKADFKLCSWIFFQGCLIRLLLFVSTMDLISWRGLCSGLLLPYIKGSQAFFPLVSQHWRVRANLIEEPAPGRVFRDSLLSPNAVISSSLCWGGIKITKKVILSIFFLIIIVRRGDKRAT